MRIVETKVYSYEELTSEAKQKAIEGSFLINVEDNWWHSIYDDAKNIKFEINSFDIDRPNYCNGNLMESMNTTIVLIIVNHGETCGTYSVALEYRTKWDELVSKYSDGVTTDVVAEENEYEFDQEANDLEESFKEELCNEYLKLLKKEAEHLMTKEAIIETFESRGCEFTENGNIY